ncbi:hypothetical protein [Virgibacillus proomii]|uniref:hypothetical protein n=1 Tax=Virgibacillus proomii TaxID=84407 RepID=UPI001C10E482|nr:hypothetical protein [Virgibacillus proomii]MBU5266929.1 hypothetical protein [Virgibacillus proomii]
MNPSIEKSNVKHANPTAKIRTFFWKQIVEGRLSEEYQYKNIVYWFVFKKRIKKTKKFETAYFQVAQCMLLEIYEH